VTDLAAVYRDKSPSTGAKATLAAVHLGIVLSALWLLLGGGLGRVDALLGREPHLANPTRRGALAAAAALYFLRTLFTVFVFVRRRMPWSEVATIAVWIGALDAAFAYFGGRNETAFGPTGLAGGVLVLAGSVLNTGSEWQRHLWKRGPGHEGHLFTGGFFGFARHINYFGDLVLFTGWAMVAGRPAFLLVPVVMLCGFVFANVPAQERYLAERYREEFRVYAERTARLIPYVY